MEKKRSMEMTIILLSLCFSTFTFAETIILKSGQKIEAKIIEKTDEYIVIDFYGSHVSYNMDEIVKIEEKKSIPPIEEIETSISPKEVSYKQLKPETNQNSYTNEEHGVRLVFPKDWFVIPEETSTIKAGLRQTSLVTAYRYKPKETDKASNPCIIVRIAEHKGKPTLEILKLSLQITAKLTRGRFINPPHEIIVNGEKVLRVVMERKTRDGIMIESTCKFVRGNKSYTLNYFCNSEDFPKYKEDFEKVINSFEFR